MLAVPPIEAQRHEFPQYGFLQTLPLHRTASFAASDAISNVYRAQFFGLGRQQLSFDHLRNFGCSERA